MRAAQNHLLESRIVILTTLAFCFALVLACCKGGEKATSLPRDRHQPFNFIGHKGMVVAAHPLAAEAGREILRKGGNAVDAAIATAFALNAAEPFASGIGGGGFMVIYLADENRVTAINFREKAPSKASPEMFIEDGETNEIWRSAHGLAVAVPGALAGWSYALQKYGTKTLGEVMERGIDISEKGFPVSSTFSKINKDEYEKLVLLSGESSCYLNNGFPFEEGEILKNPELATTFRLIASQGTDVFYRGELAQKIITAVQAKGGIMTVEDLAGYAAVEHVPILGTYKNFTLYSPESPASGGLHIIQLLNIIENWPVKEWGQNSVPYIHHLSEAFRFIFADRSRYLGDPVFVDIPATGLTSKNYAARIASVIKEDRVLGEYPYGDFDTRENETENTTHLCVTDEEGNIVSLTQTINYFFGSGIIPDGTGFLLNNEMDDFSPVITSPNAPGPDKRPLSSQGPLILFKDDTPFLVLGSPGGTRIFTSLLQIILNVIEFGMNVDEAIEAPRFFSYSTQGEAGELALESRIPQSVIDRLKELGHEMEIRDAYDTYFGGAQAIMILRHRQTLLGGADSRRDGCGAGY
ncbi:MAG: gamma-glutamyltransferase [Candidatus Aminicenantes bacterium]|nr:gamma-glutamyltransferase [Candidatus Aminicenantes bacterium]